MGLVWLYFLDQLLAVATVSFVVEGWAVIKKSLHYSIFSWKNNIKILILVRPVGKNGVAWILTYACFME